MLDSLRLQAVSLSGPGFDVMRLYGVDSTGEKAPQWLTNVALLEDAQTQTGEPHAVVFDRPIM
jgi:hypothetical protein